VATDLFISSASDDKSIADAVVAALEGAGFSCWMAARDLPSGAPLQRAIVDALKGARSILVILSSNALQSTQVHREITVAVDFASSVLIPVVTEDVKLTNDFEYLLAGYERLDVGAPPTEDSLQRLVRHVESILNKQKSPPTTRLSELPEIVGFFSYSREDDRDSEGGLSSWRRRIQNELRGQLGRSGDSLRVWQDAEAIPPGTHWRSQIEAAVNQSVFFIPIITPRVVASQYCGVEFQRFLDREKQLGRNDLVFPIIYIDVPDLRDEKIWHDHPVLRIIAERQHVDWREYRFDPDSPALRRAVSDFSATLVATLRHQAPKAVPVAVKPRPIERHDAPPPPAGPIVSPTPPRPPSPEPAAREPRAPASTPNAARSARYDIRTWSLLVGLGVIGLIIVVGLLQTLFGFGR
jgi:hypothetical protein